MESSQISIGVDGMSMDSHGVSLGHGVDCDTHTMSVAKDIHGTSGFDWAVGKILVKMVMDLPRTFTGPVDWVRLCDRWCVVLDVHG